MGLYGMQASLYAGFRQTMANGTVLRPFLQIESPFSSQEFGLWLQAKDSGFKLMTCMLGVERSSLHPLLCSLGIASANVSQLCAREKKRVFHSCE